MSHNASMCFQKCTFVLAVVAALLVFPACQDSDDGSSAALSVAPVTFSPDGGVVPAGTVVTLSSATAGAVIWYATEMPFYPTNYTKKGTKASSVTVTDSCTLYAVAVDGAGHVSTRSSATFTVTSSENTALYFGNPSEAVADETQTENFLIEREAYSLSYNDSTHNPNWVAWHFCAADMGSVSRSEVFLEDTALPDTFYKVQQSDYQYSTYGFDRGHMCPSYERTSTVELNTMTFYMTNMVPQSGENNQKVWAGLEVKERNLAKDAGKELYIVSGPYGTGGSSSSGSFRYIKVSSLDDNGIVVPAYTWKIILVLEESSAQESGETDRERVNAESTVIAVMIPNTNTCLSSLSGTSYASQDNAWKAYLTTIDDIEEKTGFDFFSTLPDDIEEALEQKIYQD